MESVGAYLIAVTAAALLCGILTKLAGDGVTGAAIRLLTGLIMALSLVSPWLNIRLDGFELLGEQITLEAEQITGEAEKNTRSELEIIITQQVRTYILDKAEDLGVQIGVEVTLSDGEIPIPCAVTVRGAVSPYAKSVLSGCISDELGIGAEGQTWINS